jgi:hypothetical protein
MDRSLVRVTTTLLLKPLNPYRTNVENRVSS